MSKVIIGKNVYRGKQTPIVAEGKDRLRHTYMIGKTGVGKSTLYQNMALQDIINQNGVCYIDPHGESIDWLLERIPEGRKEDVILFDPSDGQFPIGLNLLEASDENEKDFIVSELIGIFYKLFDPNRTGIIGPQFEHWLRNAALTAMSGPRGGSLAEIPRLFVDKRFESAKRKHITDPVIIDFWSKQIAQTSDFHKSEMLNYFTSKFGGFLNNRLIRNIISQTRSTFSFDEVINNGKILLVNLSKGKIGEINAHMLGLIIITKLQASILKRAHIEEAERNPFYLYVDEFQNVVTDTFAGMLSESRKYGLAVNLTNQYFAQLPENIQDSIKGNVGTTISFEVGAEDAEMLSKEFGEFTKDDFINLEKYNFYIKLMIGGKTSEGFSGISLPPLAPANQATKNSVIKISRLAYGLPKQLVEAELATRR